MDATSPAGEAKCRKRNENTDISCCKKLCDLPDALLLRILELLPMEYAVRTSVLSRRWEFLWTSIPNLLFDETEFPNQTLFMNFVERALVCRDCSSMNAFSLSCSVQSDAARINAWIAAAVRCNVQKLELQLYDIEQPYVLPCCLSRCKTLTEFDLDMPINLRIPSLVCFRSIKVLRLEQVNFVDNDCTGELFSGPALQELRLTRCSWTALKVLKISAPNLWRLNISVCDEYDGRNCQVLINGARLTRFHYCGELFCDHDISGLDLLVKAYINVDMGSQQTVDQIHRGYKLLRKLSNVKKLTLLGEVVKRMDVFSQTFDGILDPMPPCFLSSLKKITICFFYATDAEISAVRVLLRTAKALEELVIHCDESCSEDAVGDLRHLVEMLLHCGSNSS
ncbi:hypothetical protein EUGRSUZ_E04100 [Eucalyptus grandis]|uniref:Uncharacterized protein n=2 Tax=Eucalyptus grandis TaxID=71139 RepID=A0ACC3L0J7_EUCGR|nr:hypothetical protein EUGRSUZ_E04100 [Eucalyptus grandis]